MWTGFVSKAELADAGRWTVAYFAHDFEAEEPTAYRSVPLREIVSESKNAIEPKNLKASLVNYIGLENVRSLTGELVDFEPRPPSGIKSRSKMFQTSDILFGRLRPELNKVYLVDSAIGDGICSSEFLVLNVDRERADPIFMRYALASPFVSRFAQKLRTGASLPRMSAADLLDLQIPLPPLDMQRQIGLHLSALDHQLKVLRSKLEWLPAALNDAFVSTVSTGEDAIVQVQGELGQVA